MTTMDGHPTYEDYLWTENGGSQGEFGSFCLTLIENANVTDVFAELPVVEELGSMTFSNELLFRSYDDWDGQRLLVGLVQVGSWTVMYEVNGFAGVVPGIVRPLSKGRRIIVHHYSDANFSQRFSIYEDGQSVANFSPSIGIDDLQSDPDLSNSLTTLMQESGFGQSPDDEPEGEGQYNRAAAFALTERLTGVRLTPETIAGATFTVVRIRVPR